METAARLAARARAENERRLLVLTGDPTRTRERAAAALDAAGIDRAATTYLGPTTALDCECLSHQESHRLLGTTRKAVVLDCHERCEPNTVGQVVGTVDGGGLFVLLTPPLEDWPDRHDAFDDSLAVPPSTPDDVTGHFRRRLVETLSAHRGVSVVDAEDDSVESDGSWTRGPALADDGGIDRSDGTVFPAAAYRACLTGDQHEALAALEALDTPGTAVVVEADRGRGKSSVAGLAAGALALDGRDVLVTAPGYRSASALFERAAELLADLDALVDRDGADRPRRLETAEGVVRFCEPATAAGLPDDPDRVFVDEAAALPVALLRSLLGATGVAFTTTVHGYEGTGRGFSVRFRESLGESEHGVTDVTLSEPVRYAAGDPVEVWSFRALALDARPPVAPLVTDTTPDSVTYRELSPEQLLADEVLLREVFGLLVLAHYRTEPNDLARALDAPNVSVHALLADGHPVSVALLAREGGLTDRRSVDLYEGATVRGNLVPDLLASQLRDERAPRTVGHRVLRIATHGTARSRGLGSVLLARIREQCEGDWLGVSFGATPRLVSFWRENGFRTVHLGTSRNARSGEHSAVLLDPVSPAGQEVHDRHAAWFLRRLPGVLSDSLDGIDPDLVRAVCRATDATPALDLTDFEWRVAAGIPHGAALVETAPRPVQRLTLYHLTDGSASLSDDEERVLVLKALQARSWEAVSDSLETHTRECKRTLGRAVERLVGQYGDETAVDELARFDRESE